MSLKDAKIPRGPAPTRLFAHATDTDDAVTPPTAVSDCLGARAAKNRQQLNLGKGALIVGNTPLGGYIFQTEVRRRKYKLGPTKQKSVPGISSLARVYISSWGESPSGT